MNNTGRVVAGFLVAPVVAGMLLYLYGPANGYGVAAVVGPLLCGQPIRFGELFVAVIYAAISAAVFWGLAVRRTPRGAETATRRTT